MPQRAMSRPLVLYRRESCHLCEYALEALAAAGMVDFDTVDIGWEGPLADRYGWRIPVLRDAVGGRELDWPFDAWAVRRFVAGG
jgi:hypothetical protein